MVVCITTDDQAPPMKHKPLPLTKEEILKMEEIVRKGKIGVVGIGQKPYYDLPAATRQK